MKLFLYQSAFLFAFFQLSDVRGHLEPHDATIGPVNGTIIIDVPFFGDRILAFPNAHTGRMAMVIDDLDTIGIGDFEHIPVLSRPSDGDTVS